jgi:phosphatidate cytidylyltransferase
MIGGPKLASRISPNKTWSGLCGGIFAAGIVGSIYNLVLMHENVIPLIVLSTLLGLLSQGGDLLESWIKRRFDKKDSGSLIPGHGGLFDRVDGLLAAAVGAAFISIIIKGSPLTWG